MGYVTSRILRAFSQVLSSQRRLWLTAFLVVGALTAGFEAVLGQAEWPSRPINLLVPYSAGSASDTLARTLIGPLHEKIGQPFIIENRVGADGMIAGRAVARSEPNGYTQYFGVTTSLSLAFNLQPNLGFDPRKDYAPISMVGQTAYLLVVSSTLGVNSVPELVALAKSKPGALNYSSTGEGSIAHLGMLVLAKKLGIEMTHIPDKSTAQSIVDVARNDSAATGNDIAHDPALPSGEGPYPGCRQRPANSPLPDVPTLQEQGVSDFQATFSMALFLPVGSPNAVVKRLNEAVRENWQIPRSRNRISSKASNPRLHRLQNSGNISRQKLKPIGESYGVRHQGSVKLKRMGGRGRS